MKTYPASTVLFTSIMLAACGNTPSEPAPAPGGNAPAKAAAETKPADGAAAPTAAPAAVPQPGVERGAVYEALFVKGTAFEVSSAIRKGTNVRRGAGVPADLTREVVCQITDVKHTATRAVALVTCPAAGLGAEYPKLALVPADYWVADQAGLWRLAAEHVKSIDDALGVELTSEMMLIANPPRETKLGTEYGTNIGVSKGANDAWCIQITDVVDGYEANAKLCLSQAKGLESYREVVVQGELVGGIVSTIKTVAPAAVPAN